MKSTRVSGVISVGHRSPEGDAHGHSYLISAWYRHGSDARALKRHLDVELAQLDHTMLPDKLRFAEDLAEHLAGKLPGTIRIEVDRPLEGMTGRWEIDQ